MADDPLTDFGSVLEEGRHGYAEPFDVSGNFQHLPPAERRAAKKRSYERKQRWARAEAIRATWGPEQFEEEQARLAREIEEWERTRDAA